tara:strand:- start:149 stop:526 length:378 start_codon:yes stop_codon:yes gene_type:complete
MYKEYLQKLEKLKGTELKSERVDLAVKDYDKFTTQLENLNKEIKKGAEEVIKMHEKLRPAKVEVQKKSLELADIIGKAEKQRDKDVKAAKDLGVDAQIFIKSMSSLYKLQNKGDDIINNMQRRLK